MGTSMDEIPNFREFLYQYILPQPELDLEALQGDRLELENLHAVLAEAQTRADALEEIVNYGREAAGKQTEALCEPGRGPAGPCCCRRRGTGRVAGPSGRRTPPAGGPERPLCRGQERGGGKPAAPTLPPISAAGASGEGRALDAMEEELSRRKTAQDAAARKAAQAEDAAFKAEALLTALRRSGFASGWKLENLTADTLPQLTDWLCRAGKPLEEAYFAARQNTAALRKEQADKRAELDAVSGGKWVYPHGDAATRVRDAVNAELQSRGMQPDAKIFCELLAVADESWQDCVEACPGDRRFDILVPPAHYEAAKSAFVALKDKVGPISLLDTPGIRKANRHAETALADSLAAQVTSENPLAAQYADTILRRIVCCDTPETLEQYPDSATRDLLRHHPFRLERLRTLQRYIGLEARRARAGALAEELEALAERTRTAAQTEQNLKTAYDQYQNFQRGTAPQQLADLWEARTAAEKPGMRWPNRRASWPNTARTPAAGDVPRGKKRGKPPGSRPHPLWSRWAATSACAKTDRFLRSRTEKGRGDGTAETPTRPGSSLRPIRCWSRWPAPGCRPLLRPTSPQPPHRPPKRHRPGWTMP